MTEATAQGRSVCKSDANKMGVLQLFCSIVCEQIKGAPNMYICLVLRKFKPFIHMSGTLVLVFFTW